jgi:hypothetical protein
MAMKPSRDPRSLDEEAAATRTQARGLHDAALDALRKENRSWGARRDAAGREAAAARAAADAAEKQANDLSRESHDLAERAANADVAGSRSNATNPADAEEHFEDGRAFIRLAEATSARADEARLLAQQLAERADALEQQYQAIDREPMPADYQGAHLENAADALDEKARLLGEAAEQQRNALLGADDPGAAARSTNWARDAQERADAIRPDYSHFDPQVLQDAGVPRSQLPGSELMVPEADAGPVDAAPVSGDAYRSTPSDDTDLMEPSANAFDTAPTYDERSWYEPPYDTGAATSVYGDDGGQYPDTETSYAYDASTDF